MKKLKILPTALLILTSAHASAMNTSDQTLNFEVYSQQLTTKPVVNPIDSLLAYSDGWCTNIPLSYEDAKLRGVQCN